MKSTVEHLNPTRVKLTIEVPFDELKSHFDKAYRNLASQVKVPGFRPGRVPAKILDACLGRGTVLTEVVNEAIPAKVGGRRKVSDRSRLGQCQRRSRSGTEVAEHLERSGCQHEPS